MPADVLDNPLVIALLGILVEGPMHSYHLHLELKRRRLVSESELSRGTLYNVVAAMQKQGWIKPGSAEREGNRPERQPYSITEAGLDRLRSELDERIRNPLWRPDELFYAVSHIGVLGPAGAVDALRERCACLKEQIRRDVKAHKDALAAGTPRLFVIEAEYALHSTRAELRWLERTAQEIETGNLKWPNQKQ